MSNSRKTPIPLGQGVVHLNDDLNGSNGNNKALMKRFKSLGVETMSPRQNLQLLPIFRLGSRKI